MREPSAARRWKRCMQAASSPPWVPLESGLCVDCGGFHFRDNPETTRQAKVLPEMVKAKP